MSTKRAIRIVGVSGFAGDPAAAMRRNAEAGPVDAIIGDYLAEFNLAINSVAYQGGKHPGWEQTFMDGTKDTLELINKRRIKLVTNGGALNPKGAAQEIQKWIVEHGYDLKVACVEGDNVTKEVLEMIKKENFPHLDGQNENVGTNPSKSEVRYLKDRQIVSANCYLGSRAITAALTAGADIVVCGRVADASPVMGLAAWWHGWKDDDYDCLAGALIAGHLIECSGYSTGGNFSGFQDYNFDDLTDIGFPIAEVAHDGTCIITKQESLPGLVNIEVVACQFLYELQGSIYLNSDVKARLDNVVMTQEGNNRVLVTGVKGHPPPPTTKCAIFWVDGYQCEYMIAMTGSPRNTAAKSDLFKYQTSTRLKNAGLLDKLIAYEVQDYGSAQPNPQTQFAGTRFLRIFIQAKTPELVVAVIRSHMSLGLEHFSGYHSTIMTNPAQAVPRPFLGYYPGLYQQSDLHQTFSVLSRSGSVDMTRPISAPRQVEAVAATESYEPRDPVSLSKFGETVELELGAAVLARSGDKGGNINIGFIPRLRRKSSTTPTTSSLSNNTASTDAHWDWLRSFLTIDMMKQLMGGDWREEYAIERVEFPGIKAVHFVIYGILGRGVTSSPVLDNLGKGFADYIRAKHIPIPRQFLQEEDFQGIDNKL